MVTSIVRFYTTSASIEDMFIQSIMEEEVKGDAWKSLKQTQEARIAEIRAVCGKVITITQLKCHMSDTDS